VYTIAAYSTPSKTSKALSIEYQVIRKNTTYLPVIADSASLENKAPCLEAGANKFLLKLHPSTELKKALEEFFVKNDSLSA